MIIFVQMWLRWTLPRPRIDQVLYACVKVLLPLACVLLLGAAMWQLVVPRSRPHPVASTTTRWSFADWQKGGAGRARSSRSRCSPWSASVLPALSLAGSCMPVATAETPSRARLFEAEPIDGSVRHEP